MGEQGATKVKVPTTREKIINYSGKIYVVLSVILVLCVVIQIALAGVAIFVDMAVWVKHMYFVYFFEFIPAVMFLLGSAACFPRHLNLPNFVLFILINIQYHTAGGWIGIIHTLLAFLILMLSISMAKRSYRYVLKKEEV